MTTTQWSYRDMIVARRVRDAFVARVHRFYKQAKASNDAQQTTDGDARVTAVGLVLADLQRLDIKDVPPPATEPIDLG